MMYEIQNLMINYYSWLKDKTILKQIEDWVEITTPYLDRHNDYVQIYAKRDNGGILLTDDGYTISDLEDSGCRLESQKRQALLRVTLNGFGVKLDGNELKVHASNDNFAIRKHNLVQAILAVNDMFYLAEPMVASIFYEDVLEWLDENNVRYTPKVKFTGKTGYDHLFDFVIPKSSQLPERIIRAINNPDRQSAQTLILAWIDTKEARPQNSELYAVLNDSSQNVHQNVLEAFRSYSILTVLWNQRDLFINKFAG